MKTILLTIMLITGLAVNTYADAIITGQGTLTRSGGTPVVEPPTDGLVGYWSMDRIVNGQILDGSGYGANGTITGAIAADGILYQGLYFDGIDDLVTVGNRAQHNFGTGSFSYGCWVNIGTDTGAWDMPMSKGGASVGIPGYDFELGSGVWLINISNGSVISSLNLRASPVYNTWTHIFAVIDRTGTNILGFVNGVQTGTTSISSWNAGSSTTGTSSLRLGSNGSGFWINGRMDETRIYNRALSATEIANIYTYGLQPQSRISN